MVNDEIAAQFPEDQQTTLGGSVILFGILTCGIYFVYWYYIQGEKLDVLKNRANIPTSNSSGLTYLLLSVFRLDVVACALIQNDINNLVNSSNVSSY